MPEPVVLDASAMIEVLLGTARAPAVGARIRGHAIHVPAHFDAEILSAFGRQERAGEIDAGLADDRLQCLADAPFERHALGRLLPGAWSRRHNLRFVDALYAELAAVLGGRVVTVDRDLAAAVPWADLVE